MNLHIIKIAFKEIRIITVRGKIIEGTGIHGISSNYRVFLSGLSVYFELSSDYCITKLIYKLNTRALNYKIHRWS